MRTIIWIISTLFLFNTFVFAEEANDNTVFGEDYELVYKYAEISGLTYNKTYSTPFLSPNETHDTITIKSVNVKFLVPHDALYEEHVAFVNNTFTMCNSRAEISYMMYRSIADGNSVNRLQEFIKRYSKAENLDSVYTVDLIRIINSTNRSVHNGLTILESTTKEFTFCVTTWGFRELIH